MPMFDFGLFKYVKIITFAVRLAQSDVLFLTFYIKRKPICA